MRVGWFLVLFAGTLVACSEGNGASSDADSGLTDASSACPESDPAENGKIGTACGTSGLVCRYNANELCTSCTGAASECNDEYYESTCVDGVWTETAFLGLGEAFDPCGGGVAPADGAACNNGAGQCAHPGFPTCSYPCPLDGGGFQQTAVCEKNRWKVTATLCASSDAGDDADASASGAGDGG